MAFIAGAGVAVTLAVGAFRLIDGAITAGDLLLVLLLVGECFLPAREINEAMHNAVWGMSKSERAFAVLETRRASRRSEPARLDGDLATDIRFEGVTFRYRPGDAPAIDG